jgi:hypothetical protein
MQVKDLDGNLHTWNLTGRMAYAKFNKSDLHLRTRMLLNETYPTLQVLEEVPMFLKKGVTLYMDFYLPLKKMCVEVHGEQHYKFVQFYHQNMVNFVKAQKRDREKEEWCEINGIRYIALPFNQTDLQWKDLIINE